MDLADRAMHHAFLFDALALLNNLPDYKKRNAEHEMDRRLLPGPHAVRHGVVRGRGGAGTAVRPCIGLLIFSMVLFAERIRQLKSKPKVCCLPSYHEGILVSGESLTRVRLSL